MTNLTLGNKNVTISNHNNPMRTIPEKRNNKFIINYYWILLNFKKLEYYFKNSGNKITTTCLEHISILSKIWNYTNKNRSSFTYENYNKIEEAYFNIKHVLYMKDRALSNNKKKPVKFQFSREHLLLSETKEKI